VTWSTRSTSTRPFVRWRTIPSLGR
jgi:hypothetical protein